MKAKEYYKKYGIRIIDNDKDAIVELVNALIAEMKATMDARHVSTDKGLLNAIDEYNNKWNTICQMFEKPTLQPNAFKYNIYRQLGITPVQAVMRKNRPVYKTPAQSIPQ